MNNNELNKILNNSDPSKLIGQLNEEQAQLFNSLLKDEAARKKFLSSEEAQKILKMIYGGQ